MSLSPASFARVAKLVHERAAIVLELGKEYLVASRLTPVAAAYGYETLDELCRAMERDSNLQAEVVEAMTTNETSFFRDQYPFEALKNTILPELIERRASQRSLRIWCAACSTGQEPYSVAMLLEEHFPVLGSWQVQIVATDLSQAVLQRARAGCYGSVEVSRGLSPRHLAAYFVRRGGEWEIKPSIRQRVRFEKLNLVEAWPFTQKYDVILLRNVLIYFDPESKLSILQRVREQLADDGYLLLGGGETAPSASRGFERLSIPRASIYRAGSPHCARPQRPSWPGASLRPSLRTKPGSSG